VLCRAQLCIGRQRQRRVVRDVVRPGAEDEAAGVPQLVGEVARVLESLGPELLASSGSTTLPFVFDIRWP
jgi:hypothetical protein